MGQVVRQDKGVLYSGWAPKSRNGEDCSEITEKGGTYHPANNKAEKEIRPPEFELRILKRESINI
jgi:hypothetical protein